MNDGPAMLTRPIASIIVGKRHRRDLGDIAYFARRIESVGLLQPIVIRPDGRLIGGARRLAAFKALGRAEIPVTVVDLAEIVRGELAENVDRKGFTPSEIDAIRQDVEALERGKAKARQMAGLKRGAEKPVGANCHDGGKTRDKVAAFAGISGRTVDKIAAVVAAAKAEPERFGKLVESMDKSGNVNGPYRRLVNIRQASAIRAEAPPFPDKGPYRVIAARSAVAVRDRGRRSVGPEGPRHCARRLHFVVVDDLLSHA